MNIRYVAFLAGVTTPESVYMVCILLDRAQVGSTREAVAMNARTTAAGSRRFADMDPGEQEATLSFYGAMRVLGAVVFRSDLSASEAVGGARARVLTAATQYAAGQSAEHLVIAGADDLAVDAETMTLALAGGTTPTFEHRSLDEEPLLWIPESVAHTIAHGNPTIDDLPGWLLTGTRLV